MIADKEHEWAKRILITFAQYGFRKTSMADIANAAGISRQSVYKRFGTKEGCYEWTINTYLFGMYTKIFDLLEHETLPSKQILLEVFDVFIGQAVEVTMPPHGPEVFKDTLRITHDSKEDWPLRFKARLADFLVRHRYASPNDAKGLAFCLISAGKGLLLEEPSREHFLEDIEVIIDSVCSNDIQS